MRRSKSSIRSLRRRAQGKVLVGLHRREWERQCAKWSDAFAAWAEGLSKLGVALQRSFTVALQEVVTRNVIKPLIRSMVAEHQPTIGATTCAPLDRGGWMDRPGWRLPG